MSLIESLKLSDSVDFVGCLSAQEMADYYRRSCYFISIPTSDHTSVSLLENMACGCVPIVSDIPANINRGIIRARAIGSDGVIAFKNKIGNNIQLEG